ncbi:hypothetical protein ABEB36_015416 [Hypothenemus hampei]|uniref:Uncharacterized protein n=1 Tax=Hypothenemus hampei TaxID=57062 RepID=A0ABD1E054_HYPHA
MERVVKEMARAPLGIIQKEIRANGSLPKDDQGSVTVMGMETTECSESGKKWSRPESPVLPHPQPKEPSPPPQQIFLDTALPPQSQILVADSATETEKDEENDSSVVLAGKMTLSVISSDSETGTEDSGGSSGSRKSSSDEKNTISASSSHISEGFEKISAADLEDQIESIIEEATDNVLVVRAEENESNNVLKDILEEELKRLDDTLLEVQNVESNLDPLEANIKEEIPTDVAQSLSEDTLLITFEALKEPQDSTMEASQIGKSATSQTQGFLDVEAIEIAQSKEIDDELTAIKAQENLPINALLLKDDIVPPGDEVDDQLIKSNSESLQTSQENPPVTSLLVTPEVMKGNADSLDENYVVDQESIKEIDNAAVALLPEDNLSSLSKEQDATSFLEESLLDNKPNTIQPTRHFRLGEPTVEEILRNELEMAENQAATVKENDNLPCEEKSTVVKSSELNNVQPEISLDEVLPEPDELQPVLDVEELVIEDIVYHDEDSEDEDYDEDERETNVNGMSDIADNDELEDEDIEEVIEYVENTDEEGEEIVEVNANGEIDR